ncbi:MAG TPA: hypothetical protein VGF44_17475 [Terriglobales bacterium]|jgi:5'-deoxynucleotidase YfbR-like HD superfamily hydrolase
MESKQPAVFNVETVVKQIKPEWQNEFRCFIDSGDASDEFLAYLDSSEEGKKAVEEAFNAQADALTGLADALKSLQTENVSATTKTAEAASIRVTEAVEGLLQLSPAQGEQAVAKAASALGASVGQEQRSRLVAVAQSLSNALGNVAVHE